MSILENRPTTGLGLNESVFGQQPVGRDSYLDADMSILENRPTTGFGLNEFVFGQQFLYFTSRCIVDREEGTGGIVTTDTEHSMQAFRQLIAAP